MATKISKRKRPRKEDKTYKIERKIEGKVFDRETLKVLSKFIGKGLFDKMDNPIKMGKEANVFRGVKLKDNEPFKYYAVKIYRIETTSFKKMGDYIFDDPRFRNVRKSMHDFIKTWTRKEYINLKTCYLKGVNVPEPVAYDKTVIIMEFLGEDGLPYGTLNVYNKEGLEDIYDIELFFDQWLEQIKKILECKIVHADMSEYNVIVTPIGPRIIDMAQAVSLKHPKAKYFLERDMKNYLIACKKFKVERHKQVEELLEEYNIHK